MKYQAETMQFERHMERLKNDKPLAHFHMKKFDELIGGVRPRMTIIAGEPGTGKTSLLLQLADDLAEQGQPILFVTLEIEPSHLVAKSIARLSQGALSASDVALYAQGKEIDVLEYRSYSKAKDAYTCKIAPNIMFTSVPDVVSICNLVSECEKATGKKPVVFLDYIQVLLSGSSEVDERIAIRNTVGELRRMVNAYNVPLFAISSINRTSYDKPISGLGSLGGSSAVEYGSDTIMFFAIEGTGKERARIMALDERPLRITVLKSRYGACGEIGIIFDAAHATFREA